MISPNNLTTSSFFFDFAQTNGDYLLADAECASQSSSSSSSQYGAQLFLTTQAHTSVSSGMKDLSGKPTLSEVLEAVGWARAAKNGLTETAHLLEHLNKAWLFELYKQSNNTDLLAILGQKIEIRHAFELSLMDLSKMTSTQQHPTCFVSFALEEGVSQWLEKTFVPDLALVGVDPVFCFKDLHTGMDLNAFEEKILETDQVVVICTPISQKYCRDRHPPYGFAQEVVLAKKRKQETVHPIWLKGDPKQFDPNILFGIDNTFGSILNEDGRVVWSYYAKAFELFADVRGDIGRDKARTIKEQFFKCVETILNKQTFRIDDLKRMARSQDSETRVRVEGIAERMKRLLRKVSLPPYPVNFSGRSDDLQKLRSLYESGKRHVAITGPSGIGKSDLALAFAHQSERLFDFIYLIQVTEHASLKQGLLKLADDIGLDGTEEDRLTSLKSWLKRSDHKHLILLDNIDAVDFFKELKEFVEPSQECCFLLTSVMTDYTRRLGFTLYHLNSFQPEEALDFLRASTHIRDDDENGRRLAAELYYSPVALARAADYIKTINCRFTTFLEIYQKEGIKLLSENAKLLSIRSPPQAQTTLTAWRSYLIEIQKRMNGNICATQLLNFASSRDEIPIPYKALRWWANENGFGDVVDQALGWLLEYALINSPNPEMYILDVLLKKEIDENRQVSMIVSPVESPSQIPSVYLANSVLQSITPDIIIQGIRGGKRPKHYVGMLNSRMLNPQNLSKPDKINIFRSLDVLIPRLDENDFPSLTEPRSPFREFFKHSAELWEEQAKLAFSLGSWYKTRNQWKSMFFFSTGIKICERHNHRQLSNDFHVAASTLLCAFADPSLENIERAITERIQSFPKRNTDEHIAALTRLVRLYACADTQLELQPIIESEIGLCGSPDLIHIREAYARSSKRAKLSSTATPLTIPTKSYHDALQGARRKVPDFGAVHAGTVRKIQEDLKKDIFVLLDVFLLDAFALIGLPPCDYDLRLIGMRKAASRYFPFELLVLVNNDGHNERAYFKKLLDLLHLQMISLGESLDCASFADLFDLNDSGGITRLGVRIDKPSQLLMQVGTPKALAELKFASEFQSLIAHQSMSVSSNSESLFIEYRRLSHPVVTRETESITFPIEGRTLADCSSSTFNLRTIEDYMYQLLLNVTLQLKITGRDHFTIIDEWTQHAGLKPTTAWMMKAFLTDIYRIRLRLENEKKNDFDRLNVTDLSKDERRQLIAGYLLIVKPLVLLVERANDQSATNKRARQTIAKAKFIPLIRDLNLIKQAFKILSSEELENTIEHLTTLLHDFQAKKKTLIDYYQLLGTVNCKEDRLRNIFIQTLEKLHNPHVNSLLTLPNKERMRVSETRSQNEFLVTLRALTLTEPSVDHPNVKITAPSLGICYLKIDQAKKPLFDVSGKLTRKHQGLHPVNSLTLPNQEQVDRKPIPAGSPNEVALCNKKGIHLKGMPTGPLIEWGIHDLLSQVAGEMTPQTELVKCEIPGRERPYPILLSQTVLGEPLSPKLKWEDCDQKQWTWMFLTQILTKPGDGHESNFLLVRNRETNKWMIICVDNDISFFPSVTKTDEGLLKIRFASVLFCLFPHVKLDREVLEEFATLNGDEIVSKWMQRLVNKEEQYKGLFDEKERQALYDEESDFHFKPTMLLKQGTLLILCRQFSQLQTFIQEKLMTGPETTLTPVELLSQLVDIDAQGLSQTIGSHVASKYGRCGIQNQDLNEQLKRVTGRDHHKSLVAPEADEIVLGRIPTAQEIEKRKDFTVEQASDELAFFINSKKIYELDFATIDPFRHGMLLEAKLKDHVETKAKPEKIAIKNCDALDTKALKKLLHRGVQTLDLSGCKKLTNADIALICQLCPNLKTLRLNHTTITEFDAQSAFPKLFYLELKGCKALKLIEVRALFLDDVKISETENQVDDNIRMVIYTSKRIRPPNAFDEVLYTFLHQSDLEDEYIPNLKNVWYDRDVALDAIKNNVFGLNFIVRPPLKSDREVCLAFLRANQQSTQFKDTDPMLKGVVYPRSRKANQPPTELKDTNPVLDRLDPKFKNDVEVVKAAVRFQSINYGCLDENMQDNEEVALALIDVDPSNFLILSKKMRKQKDIIIAGVGHDYKLCEYVTISMWNDPAIFIASLRVLQDPSNELKSFTVPFELIGCSVMTSRECVLEWIIILIKFADSIRINNLLKNLNSVDMAFEFMKTNVDNNLYYTLPPRKISVPYLCGSQLHLSFADRENAKEGNKRIIFAVICRLLEGGSEFTFDNLKEHFQLLAKTIDPSYWSDAELAAALINLYITVPGADDTSLLLVLDKCVKLKSVKQFFMNVLGPGFQDNDRLNLIRVLAEWMDTELWKDRDVVTAFVKYDSHFINRAPSQLQNDEQVIARCNIKSLRDAPEKLKQNPDVVIRAIEHDKDNFQYAHEKLKKEPLFLCRAMKISRGVSRYIRFSSKLAFAMVKIDYRNYDYIGLEFQKTPDLLELMDCCAPKNYVKDYEKERHRQEIRKAELTFIKRAIETKTIGLATLHNATNPNSQYKFVIPRPSGMGNV